MPGQGYDGIVDLGAYEFQGTSCPWDCAGNDGVVGIEDFLAVLATWGQTGVPCDVSGDGVGIDDFLAVLGFWGSCP